MFTHSKNTSYPVVAAFRSLLVFNDITNKYEWKNNISPINVWNDVTVCCLSRKNFEK